MENLLNKFLEMYREFTKNPLHFLAFSIICFGGYILYTELDYIKSLFPQHNQEYFEQSLERDRLINQSLQLSKNFINAKTVAIAQFHNGQYDLTRLPFTSVSVTYFTGETTLDTSDIFNSRPLSSINQVMIDMWKSKDNPVCMAYEVKDIPDLMYRQRMEAHEVTWISICPLVNILNYPIGYSSIGYDFVPGDADQIRVVTHQRQQASRISGYLQEINDKS